MSEGKRRGKGILIALVCVAASLAMLIGAVVIWSGGPRTALQRLVSMFNKVGENDIKAALLEVGEKNPEAVDYVENYEGIKEYDHTLDLTGELKDNEIPYYTQWDSRWGYCRYGNGLIGYTGCGPTCLSMVLMGLTGDGTMTPAHVAEYAIQNGYCVAGNGTAWTLFSDGAEELGLDARELPLWEADVRSELNKGHPVICVMGPGHFTETGHYIILCGCDEDGFSVLDPYRPSNNEVKWSFDDISGEIRNLWAYSYEPAN